MKRYLIIYALLCCGAALGQHTSKSNQSYYDMPMDIPPLLAGGFAEFRTGHFHSGIDFRTQAHEGVPVRAVADGTLSRIAYAASGYGRVLYIDHPNGTTSVYAHLQRFTPALEKWFDDRRYESQEDQIDLRAPAGKFTFRQGELIGYSGNSGGSSGPHLHFEIRDTPTQEPLNPLAVCGLRITDDLPPVIHKLYYIRVDTLIGVPVSSGPLAIPVHDLGGGRYSADTVGVGRSGYFVIGALDYMNGTQNRMGIYSVRESIDSREVFTLVRDRFAFSDTRYINSVGHYTLNRGTPLEMIRLAVQQGNRIPMCKAVGRGAVLLDDTLPHRITVALADERGNRASIEFCAVRRTSPPPAMPDAPVRIVRTDKQFIYSDAAAGITVPAGVLYEPAFYTQRIDTAATKRRAYSPVVSFHSGDVPMHGYATIWLRAQLPEHLCAHACLARVGRGGALSAVEAKWLDGQRLSARVREFGSYCVCVDTVQPLLTPRFNPARPQTGKNRLEFTVSDDFSGVCSYKATIDGRWALLEYDPKNRLLTHPVDTRRFGEGSHSMSVEVTDRTGNRTVWSGGFSN